MERTHQHCEYDFATGRTDLLLCGVIEDHRVVLMPERRVVVLSELKALGLLVGAALAEATQPAE